MPLINKDIIKLIEDVECGCGMIDDEQRRYTEFYPQYNGEFNQKVSGFGHVKPGSKVLIYWDAVKLFKEPDEGYIFTLPGSDSNDIFMSGIVHVPTPKGGEKEQPEPEWIYLHRLVDNNLVMKIEIIERP